MMFHASMLLYVYKTHIISTIVDVGSAPPCRRVYKTHIISTIVDQRQRDKVIKSL